MIYFQTDRGVLHQGHVMDTLKEMPDESCHCYITSPPYWGLRDYGIEPQVWDEKTKFFVKDMSGKIELIEKCEHVWGDISPEHPPGQIQDNKAVTDENAKGQTAGSGQFCQHCQAWRGSLGLEPDPELFIFHIVQVFREARRILHRSGTCWINLGSSYVSSNMHPNQPPSVSHTPSLDLPMENRQAHNKSLALIRPVLCPVCKGKGKVSV